MNPKRNFYWFYLLFFRKRMNLFIEGSEKNRSGSPAGMLWKIQNEKKMIFASNNIMEAVNQYRLIRNLIQIYGYIRNGWNQFVFLLNRSDRNLEYGIQRDQIENDTLNHGTIMKYTINQHLSNFKKSQKKWPDPLILISRTERSMNRDPNAYRYNWAHGSKNFQEYLEHFVSGQKSHFQVVFDRLRICINQYSMSLRFFLSKLLHSIDFDWSEDIDKNDLSKSLHLFLSKLLLYLTKLIRFFFLSLSNSLPFFFVSFGRNIPIHRSEIRISELKGPNDQLCNHLLEWIGLQIVHLKKLKALHDTSQESKFLMNGGRPNKITKQMIDSFHTINNRRKPFDNTGCYFSMISHDQDNWLNPVKPFHRSSLISAFYKANRLRFLNNPHHFSFYCKNRFPFSVNRINNYDFTYGQFLNILFTGNKKFALCGGKKKHAFLERGSPIESQVSKIFISTDFPIRPDPLVRRAIYSIANISGTPLTEEEIANFERTYCQPLSDMTLSDSEGKNLHQYLNLNSNRVLIHPPRSEKAFLSKKKKKSCKKEMYRNRIQENRDRAFSILSSKWNRVQPYIPYLFTSKGFHYLYWILRDASLDLLPILESSRILFVFSFHDIMDRASSIAYYRAFYRVHFRASYGVQIQNLQKKWYLPQCKDWISKRSKVIIEVIIEFLDTWDLNLLLSEESRDKKSSLKSNLIFPNAGEFLSSILFLLLVAGYLVCTNLLCISWSLPKFQTEFEKVQYVMIQPDVIAIEVRNLLQKYPTLEYTSWLTNIFLVALDLSVYSLEKIQDFVFSGGKWPDGPAYTVDLTRFIPNFIKEFTFSINTRYLSHTSKEIRSLLIQRKNANDAWSDYWAEEKKIESWIASSDLIYDTERELLFHFSALATEKKEKKIHPILWSLTHSDHLSKNDSGIEEEGVIYLRSLFDLHKKDLLNYEFNTSCLAERRIFLAHYQTMTYSQILQRTNHFQFPSDRKRKPFSLRLDRSPPRGILVIGPIGAGRSYLVNYLAANSYLPLVTITLLLEELTDDTPLGFYPLIERMGVDLNDSDSDDEVFEDKVGDDYLADDQKELAAAIHDPYASDEDRYDPDTDLIEEVVCDAMEELDLLEELDGVVYMTLQLEFAKAMSPCIVWIPDINDLSVLESSFLSLGLFVNSMNCELPSTRNILFFAATNSPERVDPGLIGPNQLNTCIKIRGLIPTQQRKVLFTLSHTRGFHLEKKLFGTDGFGSINMSSNVQDLAALTDEALSISIAQKKSIIDTNTIRFARHRQTWLLRESVRSVEEHGLLFYQIGRAVVQNVVLSDSPLDPLSIYLKGVLSEEKGDLLYKWFYELGTSTKKLTMLFYLLTCSAGSIAQNLWSGLDEKNGIASYVLIENDSDLVHVILGIEKSIVGCSATETEKDYGGQFDNDRVTFLLRPERNPLDMLRDGFSSMKEQKVLYMAGDEVDRKEWEGIQRSSLLNSVVWAPRIWRPWCFLVNYRKPNDLGLLFGEKGEGYQDPNRTQATLAYAWMNPTMQYKTRNLFSQEQGFFREIQFLWDPADPLAEPFEDEGEDKDKDKESFAPVFARQRFNLDDEEEEVLKALLSCPFDTELEWEELELKKGWFLKRTQEHEKYVEFLRDCQKRGFRTRANKHPLSNVPFRSSILPESYQYFSNLFLSKERLLDQITKTLFRKRWIFPDEMKIFFM